MTRRQAIATPAEMPALDVESLGGADRSGELGVAFGQACAGLTMNRSRSAAALVGFAAGIAVMTVGAYADAVADYDDPGSTLRGPGWLAGALLLGILAAATAAAVDPRQLRAAAVLDLVGVTRGQRRTVVVIEAAMLGLAALPLGWLVGLAVTVAVAVEGMPEHPVNNGILASVALPAVLIPGMMGLVAGRSRVRATVLGARGTAAVDPTRPVTLRRWILRCGFATAFLVGASWLAGTFRSWVDLDLLLWPTILMAALGLTLGVPLLLGPITRILAALPWVGANLAAALTRSRRGLLVPPVILAMVAAFGVAVHAMLGSGLDQRETERRVEVAERYELTSLSDPNLVGIDDTDVGSRTGAWAEDAIERIREEWPRAHATRIDYRMETVVAGDPLVPRSTSRRVAAATPELLAVLGLERFGPDLAAGRAITLDPSTVVDGQVTLWEQPRGWAMPTEPSAVLDAIEAPAEPAETSRSRIPVELPAVLVDPKLELPTASTEGSWSTEYGADSPTPRSAVLIRLPRPPTSVELDRIRELATARPESYGVELLTGGDTLPMAFDKEGRLDGSAIVGLRRPSELHLAVGLLALLALTGLLVAMRLAVVTRRADEDVVELAGARPSVLRRVAAYQAAILTTLGTSVGLTVGIVLTRWGIQSYNHRGRLYGGPYQTELPPIPVVVPPAVWWAMLLIPLGAALLAWLLTARRGPSSRLQPLADGLLW